MRVDSKVRTSFLRNMFADMFAEVRAEILQEIVHGVFRWRIQLPEAGLCITSRCEGYGVTAVMLNHQVDTNTISSQARLFLSCFTNVSILERGVKHAKKPIRYIVYAPGDVICTSSLDGFCLRACSDSGSVSKFAHCRNTQVRGVGGWVNIGISSQSFPMESEVT